MLDQIFRAMAEPNRRQIIQLLQDREMSSGEIASHFALTRPAISQHLKVLEEAQLVTVRRDQQRRMYHARPEGFTELRRYLDTFWNDQLQALKHFAEAEEQRRHNEGENEADEHSPTNAE